MDLVSVNWGAVIAGTVAAFGLGMIWFSPRMFGKAWSAGSHNIKAPDSAPVAAMLVTFLATFILALVVGVTETSGDIVAAILAILAAAFFVGGMDLFSQKSSAATMIDSGYVLAGGILMIAAQAIF